MLRVRYAAARLARQSIRGFHTNRCLLAAKIYDMPAMSPTMESGAIVEWKVKEGEPYQSGDSLLEIETDKSTISVDAIDDGILAKILLPDGTKDIKVGTPIAYIAEEGDDIANLEYPPLKNAEEVKPASAAAPQPENKSTQPPPTPAVKSAPAAPSTSSSSTAANTSQQLFPSVLLLLEQNNISREDAFKNIPATGPNGRILKGDVLAYLGKISAAGNESIAAYLEKSSHMDLSNIEIRESTPKESKTEGKNSKTKEPVVVAETFSINLEISYPQLRLFKQAITDIIEDSEQVAYAVNLNKASDLDDPLFDALIAPTRNATRFSIDYKLVSEDDEVSALNLNLTLNEKCFDAKDRANVFVQTFKSNLEQYLKDVEEANK